MYGEPAIEIWEVGDLRLFKDKQYAMKKTVLFSLIYYLRALGENVRILKLI